MKFIHLSYENMATSGIFQTRKCRTHQYFTSQKNTWRIIVFTGARKQENQLSLALSKML